MEQNIIGSVVNWVLSQAGHLLSGLNDVEKTIITCLIAVLLWLGDSSKAKARLGELLGKIKGNGKKDDQAPPTDTTGTPPVAPA